MVPVENTIIQELPVYNQQKHYREFHPYQQAMPIQENHVTQQHSPRNWSPYAGKNTFFYYSTHIYSMDIPTNFVNHYTVHSVTILSCLF